MINLLQPKGREGIVVRLTLFPEQAGRCFGESAIVIACHVLKDE